MAERSARAVPAFDEVKVGDELPPLALPRVTRQTLAVYCGASGDHNPVHVDSDFARAAGLGDVIAHGMLIMAYAGRLLTQWVPQTAIRRFDTRFLALTRVGDRITARGRVIGKFEDAGARWVRVEVTTTDQRGETKTAGSADIELA